MNPDDILAPLTFVDDPAEFPNQLPEGVERSKDYYASKVTYADGRQVWTWYKRGTGPDKKDPVVTTQTEIIPTVKANFDKQKAATAKIEEAAGQRTITVGDRVKQWDPDANGGKGGYTIDLGPARAPTEPSAAQVDSTELLRQKQENQRAGRGYKTDAEVERDTAAETKAGETKAETQRKEDEAKRNRWTEISKETQTNKQTGQSKVVVTERNELGETRTREASEQVTKEPAKEETVRNPKTGLLEAIERDDQGRVIGAREIPNQGGTEKPLPPGLAESLDPRKILYGEIVTYIGEKQKELMERAQLPTDDPNYYPWDKGEKLLDRTINVAKAFADETASKLTTQRGLYTDQVQQRRDSLTDAQSRRTFASTALQNAGNIWQQIGPYLNPGSPSAAPAFRALVELQGELARQYGGMREHPEIAMAPGLQQAYGLPIQAAAPPPTFAAPVAPPATQQPAGGGVTIINNPPPSPPSYLDYPGESRAPSYIPSMAAPSPAATDAGHSWTGGQLTAPGVSQAPSLSDYMPIQDEEEPQSYTGWTGW